MLLYMTNNRYVRTQGEAQKLGYGEATDVPTDKDGLMGFLNDMLTRHDQAVGDAGAPAFKALVEDTEVLIEKAEASLDYRAEVTAQISIEEAIQAATPEQLASYASNVCWRIKELTK